MVLRARLTSCRLLHLEKSNLLLNDTVCYLELKMQRILCCRKESWSQGRKRARLISPLQPVIKKSHKYRKRTRISFYHQCNPKEDKDSALFIVCLGEEDAGTMQSHGCVDCTLPSPGSSDLMSPVVQRASSM